LGVEMLRRITLALAFVLLVAAPAIANTEPAGGSATPATVSPIDTEIRLLKEAAEKFDNNDTVGARRMIDAVVASPTFSQLNASQQHIALYVLGSLQVSAKDKAALETLKRATAMIDYSNGRDWHLRLAAASQAQDDADALLSLTTIAQRWPASLDQVSGTYVERLSYRTAKQAPLTEARFQLLLALKAAFWRPSDPVDSPDNQWVELTTLLLQRGRVQEAQATAEFVSDYGAVDEMMLDRTFDIVTRNYPDRFNLQNAWARQIERLRGVIKSHPDNLEAVNELTLALINDGQAPEALALLDAAIAKAKPVDSSAAPFADMEELNWTYNQRAFALRSLGRTDEAIAEMKAGAARPENGELNVSQQLNLAQIEEESGRPADAMAVIAGADSWFLSGFGKMDYEGVRACASVQLGDRANLEAALKYMQAHKSDAPGWYFKALACAGDVRAAGQVAIELLKDPHDRGSILKAFQVLPTTATLSPPLQAYDRMIQQIYQQPDVKAAADAVGHHLTLPSYYWDM
jgi:hypothetical protein